MVQAGRGGGMGREGVRRLGQPARQGCPLSTGPRASPWDPLTHGLSAHHPWDLHVTSWKMCPGTEEPGPRSLRAQRVPPYKPSRARHGLPRTKEGRRALCTPQEA